MFRYRYVILVVIGSLAVSCVWAQSASHVPELPAGPMQAKATTACAECHETRIIIQQRLNQAAWTREVDKMVKWGAVVDAKDRDALIDYLSVNFGVDEKEHVPDRTSSTKKLR
jgi:hypothetical protein